MIDIQTDPIDIFQPKKLPGTNISNITVFNSKYRIYFEIPTPASPNGYSYNKSMSLMAPVRSMLRICSEIICIYINIPE